MKYLNFDDHGYSVLDVTRERAQMDYFVLADKTPPQQRRPPDGLLAHGAGTQQVESAPGPVR